MSLSTKDAGGASNAGQALTVLSRDKRKMRGTTLPSVVTLARWRVRQTWRLLLITGLGIVAAVMLVCAVPLYSDVSQSIGLRGVISTSYQSSDIVVSSLSAVTSKARIDQTTRNLTAEFNKKLGPYLKPLEFSIHIQPSPIYTDHPTLCSGRSVPYLSCNLIEFIGASMAQAHSHLHTVQGRLPQDSGQTAITDSQHPIMGAEHHLHHILTFRSILRRVTLVASLASHHLYQRLHNRRDQRYLQRGILRFTKCATN